jgi:hypothetical protein
MQVFLIFQNNVDPMQTQHNAAFYGIESDIDEDGDDIDETLTPRFIGSLVNDPNSYPLWGAGEADQAGIDLINDVVTFYENRRNYWHFQWNYCLIFCDSEWNKYKGYSKGVNFLKNINPFWKTIIGAEDIEIEQIGCECCELVYDEEIEHFIWDCNDIDCNSTQNCTNVIPVYNYVATHKPSDGFILVESAMNAPGANYKPHKMPGSNHFQMRNDENTRDAMRKIFDKGLERNFFKTDER